MRRARYEGHRTYASVEKHATEILGEGDFVCGVLDRTDATMHLAATQPGHAESFCHGQRNSSSVDFDRSNVNS